MTEGSHLDLASNRMYPPVVTQERSVRPGTSEPILTGDFMQSVSEQALTVEHQRYLPDRRGVISYTRMPRLSRRTRAITPHLCMTRYRVYVELTPGISGCARQSMLEVDLPQVSVRKPGWPVESHPPAFHCGGLSLSVTASAFSGHPTGTAMWCGSPGPRPRWVRQATGLSFPMDGIPPPPAWHRWKRRMVHRHMSG